MVSSTTRELARRTASIVDGARGQSWRDISTEEPCESLLYKDIDIKYHYVRDAVQKNYINVEHCETKRMIADTLTKGLPKPAFEQHRNAMNIGAC